MSITVNIEHMYESKKDVCKIRDRELIRSYKVVSTVDKRCAPIGLAVVDARLYMSRSRSASVVYCIVWIGTGEKSGQGVGSAGGGGYDKESAALGEALDDCGVVLSHSIAGVGESAIRAALVAIAEAFGYSESEYIISEAYR